MKSYFSNFIVALFGAVILIVWPSCSRNPLDVNIDKVEIQWKVNRLDQDLFNSEQSDFSKLNKELIGKYGNFYGLYLSQIIGIGNPSDPMIQVQLEHFVKDPNWQETQKNIDKIFSNTKVINDQLETAFKYHKYYFPEVQTPEVVFYNSGFNVGVFPTDEYLGIGLEWYLGPENDVIQRLAPESFPKYLKDKLDQKYLSVNAVKGWMMVKNQNILQKEDIINLMLFHGKMMYLLDLTFPFATDEIKINYSSDDIAWCKNNEYNIWTYLIDGKVLYSTNVKEIAGFFNDGPFTPGLPPESPGRTGIWMGWQAIRQFMEKNPDVSVQQLLNEQNPQRILKYYKP